MHDRGKISGPIRRAAAAALLTACAGGSGAAGGGPRSPSPRLPAPMAVTDALVLESGGVPPEDTSVTFPSGDGRVIVLRRGAPDNSLFAEIAVAPSDSTSGDSTSIRVHPLPGLYGLELTLAGRAPGGLRVTFSYGLHFTAPAAARSTYGSNIAFERTLFVTRLDGDRLTFLPSTRPGSDLLSAEIGGAGQYLVASPGGRR